MYLRYSHLETAARQGGAFPLSCSGISHPALIFVILSLESMSDSMGCIIIEETPSALFEFEAEAFAYKPISQLTGVEAG